MMTKNIAKFVGGIMFLIIIAVIVGLFIGLLDPLEIKNEETVKNVTTCKGN